MSSTQSDISTVPEPPRIHTIDDFEVIHEIGKGSFGVVKKVVKKDDRSIFALKCLSISLL